MKKPIGFEKINGETFEVMVGLTTYNFRIEISKSNESRLWIYGINNKLHSTKFENCIYIDFDWTDNQYHVHRAKIGAGSNGEFLHGRPIKARQIMSMKYFINNLLAAETEWMIINNNKL